MPRINTQRLKEAARLAAWRAYRSADECQARIDAGKIPGATRAAMPDEDEDAYVRDWFGGVADQCAPGWHDGSDSVLSTGQTRKIKDAMLRALHTERGDRKWAARYGRS